MTLGSRALGGLCLSSGLNSGLMALDYSGNGAHGKVYGALPGFSGATGRMMMFDGVDDYIECPATLGSGNFSMECFAENVLATGLDRGLITADGSGGTGWALYYDNGDGSHMRDEPGSGFGGGTPGAGVHHIVMTYDGTTVKLYENAVQTHSSAHTFAGDNSPLTIGANLARLWFQNGRMSQVATYNAALSPARVAAHYAARGNAALYQEAVLLDTPTGYWPMDDFPLSVVDSTEWDVRPLRIEVNGVSLRTASLVETLSIDDTAGEQVQGSFTLVNPELSPRVGDVVYIRYYAQDLFAGTIERVVQSVNNTLTARLYECTALDWTQILVRNKVRRNWVNVSVSVILNSVLANDLANEGMTLGTIDQDPVIPLVDADGVSAWDLVRDLAGSTGQTVYVDFDKVLHLVSSANPLAPLVLDLTTVQEAKLTIDRESFRNVQTIKATGTPEEGSGEEPISVVIEKENTDQIVERALIEGGSGRYESYEEVSHPISNRADDLSLLAASYADLRLATSGTPRQTLTVRVRGYGFRAGQFAQVSLSTLGIMGTWLIQRMSLSEFAGKHPIHDLELVLSNVQIRAYETWIKILSGGKITISLFHAITHSSQLFTTVGPDSFVVPVGVTVLTLTAKGGSGGGGGGYSNGNKSAFYTGGNGGNSGLVTSSLEVVEGQVIDLVIGAPGNAGTGATRPAATGANGTAGTLSSAYRGGVPIVIADGGGAGTSASLLSNGVAGAHGGGSGSIVTVAGGKTGGAGGSVVSSSGTMIGQNGGIGSDGSILIEW